MTLDLLARHPVSVHNGPSVKADTTKTNGDWKYMKNALMVYPNPRYLLLKVRIVLRKKPNPFLAFVVKIEV
jgi:hypothetical protein